MECLNSLDGTVHLLKNCGELASEADSECFNLGLCPFTVNHTNRNDQLIGQGRVIVDYIIFEVKRFVVNEPENVIGIQL